VLEEVMFPAVVFQLIGLPVSGALFSLFNAAVRTKLFPDPTMKLEGVIARDVEVDGAGGGAGDIVPVELPSLAE